MMFTQSSISTFFFFNDTATTEIYTLSLHDALPISVNAPSSTEPCSKQCSVSRRILSASLCIRSEEHTSELQSHLNLVCRLLLEKKTRLLLPTPLHPAHRHPPLTTLHAPPVPRHLPP